MLDILEETDDAIVTMRDEADFYLNQQNFPQSLHQYSLHNAKIIEWCAVYQRCLLLEEGWGHRYVSMSYVKEEQTFNTLAMLQ